jgi:hypothetical protein
MSCASDFVKRDPASMMRTYVDVLGSAHATRTSKIRRIRYARIQKFHMMITYLGPRQAGGM